MCVCAHILVCIYICLHHCALKLTNPPYPSGFTYRDGYYSVCDHFSVEQPQLLAAVITYQFNFSKQHDVRSVMKFQYFFPEDI